MKKSRHPKTKVLHNHTITTFYMVSVRENCFLEQRVFKLLTKKLVATAFYRVCKRDFDLDISGEYFERTIPSLFGENPALFIRSLVPAPLQTAVPMRGAAGGKEELPVLIVNDISLGGDNYLPYRHR